MEKKDRWDTVLERISSSAGASVGGRSWYKSRTKEEEGRFQLSGKDRKKYKQIQRQSLLIMFIFACLGIIIGIIENELRYHALVAIKDVKSMITVMKVCILATSLISILFLLRYYDALISLKRSCGVYLPPGLSVQSLRGAGLWWWCVFDLALLLPQPLLGVEVSVLVWNKGLGRNSVYHLDTLLLSAMFLRCYFLPRVYGDCLSEFASDAAYALGRFNRVQLDQTFIVKHVIAFSLRSVVIVFFIEVAIFAYLMMIFERPTDGGNLQHYANCVWLTVITMTTVGYGDLYPTTFLGRMVSILASFAAVILLAVTINLVISQLSLTRTENKVIEVMDRISLRRELKRWARAYIRYMRNERTKLLQARKGYIAITELKSAERQNWELRQATLGDQELLEAINDFAVTSGETYASGHAADVPELIGNLQGKVDRQGVDSEQKVKIREVVAHASSLHAMVESICKQKGVPIEAA